MPKEAQQRKQRTKRQTPHGRNNRIPNGGNSPSQHAHPYRAPPPAERREPGSLKEEGGPQLVEWTFPQALTTHDHAKPRDFTHPMHNICQSHLSEVFVEHHVYTHARSQDAHSPSTTQLRTQTPKPTPGLLWAPSKMPLPWNREGRPACQIFGVMMSADYDRPPISNNITAERNPNATRRWAQTYYETPSAMRWLTSREIPSQSPCEQPWDLTDCTEDCPFCMDLPPTAPSLATRDTAGAFTARATHT